MNFSNDLLDFVDRYHGNTVSMITWCVRLSWCFTHLTCSKHNVSRQTSNNCSITTITRIWTNPAPLTDPITTKLYCSHIFHIKKQKTFPPLSYFTSCWLALHYILYLQLGIALTVFRILIVDYYIFQSRDWTCSSILRLDLPRITLHIKVERSHSYLPIHSRNSCWDRRLCRGQ